jgi:carbonic anhydrase
MRHRAALLSLLLCAVASAATAQVMTADSQGKMTPVQALDQLRDGNARFLANKPRTHDWPKTVAATSSGQFPFAAVLSCMDSRVPPEIVFDQGIGDLFSVRVAGNVVDEDDLGSLEYAAKSGVKLIVVLGHTRCGAVHGAIDNVELGNLTALLGKIKPSVVAAHCSDTHGEECVSAVSEENVRQSMRDIRTRSPYIATALDAGKIQLVGAMYDVVTGAVSFLPPK